MSINLASKCLIALALLSGLAGCVTKNKVDGENNFPVLEGPYIGQKTPGLTPEVFAPAPPSTEHRDWGGSFSPDMKEYYFPRRDNKSGKNTSVVFKSENNRWHETVLGPQM